MDLKTFLEAVEEMRTAQKEYFRTKRNTSAPNGILSSARD